MAGRTTTREPELIKFTAADRRTVVTVMRRLARDRDGWLNLQPAVEPDDVPELSPAIRLFGSRGPAVPLGSWVPGARKRNGSVEPVSLGLQHAGGPKSLWRLRDEGHPVPEGWRVLGDHPRRGFVIEVPDDFDPERTLAWLVEAAVRLTDFDLPATWHAGLFNAR